jgi:hypothetical protein
VHDKILQARKIKRQSIRQFLPLPSTGTTVREAHVSYGETKSWRAWEAIGLGEGWKGSRSAADSPIFFLAIRREFGGHKNFVLHPYPHSTQDNPCAINTFRYYFPLVLVV